MNHEASRVIWNWRDKSEGKKGSRARRNRIHGLLQALAALGVSAAFFYFKHPIPGSIVLTVGLFLLLASQISPEGLYFRVQKGGALLGHWVGILVAFLLLIPVYWLFFAPFRLLFRRGANNKMHPQPNPRAGSYWMARELVAPEQYERQF